MRTSIDTRLLVPVHLRALCAAPGRERDLLLSLAGQSEHLPPHRWKADQILKRLLYDGFSSLCELGRVRASN